MQHTKYLLSILIVSLVCFIPTTQVFAEGALEEIIVTARTRAESLQDIPIAISAFTADDMEKKAIEGLEDVARFTAGFSFEDFGGGFGTPVIRSASQTRLTAVEANVSTFYDGIYIPRSWAVNTGVSSLERIEVVKGPQSARYGRNAFMGAVNLIPLGPTEECEGSFEITAGSDERLDVKGTIGGALIPGLVNARASAGLSEFDGSWENSHPFASTDLGDLGTTGNGGGWDNTSYSLAADITPSDRVTVGLAYHNLDISEESRGGGRVDESAGLGNCGSVTGPQFGGTAFRLFCGEIPGPADSVPVDPRSYGRQAEVEIIKFDVEFQISDLISVTYLFGNVSGDIDIASLAEADGANCVGDCNFSNVPIGGMDYDSHEIRFAGDLGNITWAAGIYYADGVDTSKFQSIALPPLTAAPTQTIDTSTGTYSTSDITETEVTAIFGEATMNLGESTRLGLELRYSQEDKQQSDERLLFPAGRGTGFVGNEEYKNFTPRLSIERDLSEDKLVYASIAKGVKSGGFNPGSFLEEDRTFDEEENWTLEIGSKNTLWNDRLQLNAAIFAIKWTDIQLNKPDVNVDGELVPTTNITGNLGDGTSYGIELDAIAQLSGNFSVNATFSYTDATYDDGALDNRFSRSINFGPFFNSSASCDDVTCPSNGDIGGNDIERQSPLQISVGAEYGGYIESLTADYYVRADVSYQDEQQAESMNLSQIPDRTILNATAGLSVGNVDLRLWARNVTDESYTSNAFTVLIPFGNSYASIYGERRTFGLTAKYSF